MFFTESLGPSREQEASAVMLKKLKEKYGAGKTISADELLKFVTKMMEGSPEKEEAIRQGMFLLVQNKCVAKQDDKSYRIAS